MEKEIRKKAAMYGIAALLLTIILAATFLDLSYLPTETLTGEPPIPVSQSAFLSTFLSYDALKTFVTSNMGTQGYYPFYGRASQWTMSSSRNMAFANGLEAMVPGAKSYTYDYSTTNIQVAGVDEADIVKTDGEYIYVLSGSNIVIVKAYPPESAEVVSEIDFADMTPMDMYVRSGRLVVLGTKGFSQLKSYYSSYYSDLKTAVNVYDISDREHPVLLRDLVLSGGYVSSRMIGNYMYSVISQPTEIVNDTVILPTISSGDETKEVDPTEIHYCNATEYSYDFTTIIALNVANSTEAPAYLTVLLGGTSNLFVSQNNMYLTFPDMDGNTSLYRVRIQASNMTCEANGKVPGRELNQFSMDEYDDHFRIVTRLWINSTSQTCLYVLNMNLTIVGRLEGLGLSENLHSSRFMGDRCYLVTFKKTDPLFVINLTDPASPAVLGELKIPGYSDYLHPYDENHIIGVGKETIEAEQGDFAWYQGVKISLFDVSNVSNPIQVDVEIIGDRGTDSPVLSDHKAFLFDKERSLLVIPALVYEIDETQPTYGFPAYGVPVWQGACVYAITADGLELRGQITHGEDSGVPESDYWVMRSLYIEDVLYTISERKVKLNSLEDLELLKEIELP